MPEFTSLRFDRNIKYVVAAGFFFRSQTRIPIVLNLLNFELLLNPPPQISLTPWLIGLIVFPNILSPDYSVYPYLVLPSFSFPFFCFSPYLVFPYIGVPLLGFTLLAFPLFGFPLIWLSPI